MTESTMATKVCKFYRTGYCKFTTKCKFFHQEESCEGHCPGKGCKLRHPKLCKYGERCRRKDKCVYKHKSSATKIDFKLQIEELTKSVKTLQDENKANTTKIAHLESELEKMKQEKDVLEKTLEDNEWTETLQTVKSLEKKLMKLEEKFEASEGTITYTSVEVKDIDVKVDVLVDVVKEQDEVLTKLEKMFDNAKGLEKEKEKENRYESSKGENGVFKCALCKFETSDITTFKFHRVDEHTDEAVKEGEAQIDEKTGEILVFGHSAPAGAGAELAWRPVRRYNDFYLFT